MAITATIVIKAIAPTANKQRNLTICSNFLMMQY